MQIVGGKDSAFFVRECWEVWSQEEYCFKLLGSNIVTDDNSEFMGGKW